MNYILFITIFILGSFTSFAQPGSMRPSTSDFRVAFGAGGIASLQRTSDARADEFIATGQHLGSISIKYRSAPGDWIAASTAALSDAAVSQTNADNSQSITCYQITNSHGIELSIAVQFNIQSNRVLWTFSLTNETDHPLEIGDLDIPLPISRSVGTDKKVLLKHSFISGNGSFLYWMKSDSAAPYLVMVPQNGTHLEYWEASRDGVYRVFIHSAAAGAVAHERGTNWRQPNTSVTLAPKGKTGDAHTYGFTFRWADNYDSVRDVLVEENGIDTQVVPGMTIPTDLFAEFSLRTRETIQSVEAEFPKSTKIESLGKKGDVHLYKAHFSKLGENRLTVHYGNDSRMYLEFFSTEPLETLIAKRGAFLARSQHRDTNKWYNGLITDWNMANETMPSPDYYAPIPRGRVYAVTCDDPGLGKPAFLAAKNAEYPVQSEVEALDYYIGHFVWGGLQQTTEEKYPYAIYGIPNWKTNRDSTDPGRNGQAHVWREYDYPHIIQMYFAMYRVAKDHPQIKTAMTAAEYLRRAYETTQAMFTIPHEVWNGWAPWGTGFYNEVVIVDLIAALEANGMNTKAGTLRGFWERKVKNFVNKDQDLFRSEYAFDSTGFESTHAFAKYAMLHSGVSTENNSSFSSENARHFMDTEVAANIFCRGWLEPAYYYLGSDYRGGGGNSYVLTYMSQMGGWSVLDYGLHYTTNAAPYIRLGYASYLSAWALMNTGTPESNYGYWYPGRTNDGGAGGGFEPAPYGQTWLGQPHHRGSWYYSSEIDLGYCGALRTAATVLTDDPMFGRFCFGGDWRKTSKGLEVISKDGLRRRFDALLTAGKIHVLIDSDHFSPAQPIILKDDCSSVSIPIVSDNPSAHDTELHLSDLTDDYIVLNGKNEIAKLHPDEHGGAMVKLPIPAGSKPAIFMLTKVKANR